MNRIEIIDAALAPFADEIEAIQKARAEIEARQDAILEAVSKASATLPPLTEEEEEDYEIIDELHDKFYEIASMFGLTWNGAGEWGDWNVGDTVEFWEPSNC